MGSRAKAGRFPWAVAGLLALALVAGVLSLVRVPVEPEPAAAPVAPIVELSRMGDEAGEQMLSEEVALLDPRPLFLPTERNAGQAGALSDDGRREPSASFENFPAQLNYKEEVVSVSFPAVVEVPSSPVKALRTDQGRDSMGSFGRRDQARPSLPPRLGYIEVIRADSGQIALQGELPVAAGAPPGDWTPVELLAAVGPAGLIGYPVLTGSSGSQGVDAWLPSFLASGYRLGERLQPGFYRIRFGP